MKKSDNRLTRRQERILNSLVCQRISKHKRNIDLLKRFKQAHSDSVNVLDHALDNAEEDDAKDRESYYIVKTKSGVGLFFFSLKCGEMFHPISNINFLSEGENLAQFVKKIQRLIKTSVDSDALKDEILDLVGQKKMTMDKMIAEVNKKYKIDEDGLERLKDERRAERNKRILRVYSTLASIHLVHFCRNTSDEASKAWQRLKLGNDRPMGEIVFWWFVAPILQRIRKLVGCENVFLFAADDSEDNTLQKYYAQSLGFRLYDELGVNKPFWDWTSIFMGKDLSSLRAEQRRFCRIFNSDQQMFKYHLPDEASK